MLRWIEMPKTPNIAKYIECYWFIEKEIGASNIDHPKLNPDPSAHLIISPQPQSYHYGTNLGAEKGQGSHWLFPHHQTFQLDHSKTFIHLGIKFRVGALYSLPIFSNQSPLIDSIKAVQLNTLFSESCVGEEQLIKLAQNNPKQCCDLLDNLLLPWVKNSHEDQHSKLTRKTLQVLSSTTISELSSQLYCSQRTLERSFSRVTGLTLKQCQSMNKLEAMLEYLYQRHSDDIDWVDVAFKFGFSDQPHLIRYLKKQLGFTPKTYEKERGLTIDVYGGVSAN